MKRLLITGGSGFLGGNLIQLAKEGWTVCATYNSRPFSDQGITIASMDLSKEKAIQDLVEKMQPDVIIHTAAWSNLDECENDPEKAFHINATATEILAELSSQLDCRLIYVSSDMVFDGEKGDYEESDQALPISVYGKTKLTGEKFVKSVCSDYVVARSALIYGKPVTNSSSFSDWMIRRIEKGETVNLFTDQYRTPVLVDDLAGALLELADMTFNGIVHLGGKSRVDRYTFGLRLSEIKNFPKERLLPVSMFDVQMTAPRPKDVSFDTSLAQRILKTNLFGFQIGLERA